jgi:hypothetical protein
VQDNRIGTNPAGTAAIPNRDNGIRIVGRSYANEIGGNDGIGVLLRAGTTRNLVINNYIGLDRRGRRLPNTGRPIVNDGSQNTIRGNRT